MSEAALRVELQSGAARVCVCWLVRDRDGAPLIAATEHDRDLVVGGVTYRASAVAIEGSAARGELGTGEGAVSDIRGIALPDSIDADLALRGRYDGLQVERRLVSWADPSAVALLDVFEIGRLSLQDAGLFTADMLPISARLQAAVATRISAFCSLRLGEARCGVDLASTSRRVTVTVAAITADRAVLDVGSTAPLIGDVLRYGTLTTPDGYELSVASSFGDRYVTLFSEVTEDVQVGDQVVLTVGCDKTFRTCVDRFDNAIAFRGCPDIPEPDSIIRRVSFSGG